MRTINLRSVSLLGVLLSASVAALAYGQTAPSARCSALADLQIQDTNLLSATVVPASGELPEYCRVLGYVRPAINFEIRLPTARWNGKFYMAGCGGYCGKIEADQPGFFNSGTYGLKRNYAVSKTDAGHWGEHVFDGKWAYHNRQVEIDWGYRAAHETARVTKTIIDAFYGRPPEYSYFQGCSTGGRMAHMEAWRYPDDFDGIISGSPSLAETELALLYMWLARVNVGPDGHNVITPREIEVIKHAVYDACDPLDGLKDGLISLPRDCRFEPKTLTCESSQTNRCLTSNQVEVLQKMYDGPTDSAGRQLYPGLPLGSEPYWELWITGNQDDPGDDLMLLWYQEFMRYLAFQEDPGERFRTADFSFDSDPARMEYMGRIYNADTPDLDAFREQGGKLLMLHGWADAAVHPEEPIRYYEALEARIGSREETQNFARLFMVPGMDHCGILDGPGITQSGFDPLTALERWVEQGEAPLTLLTTKTDSTDTVLWTRPVCPYPQRAVYVGEGAVNVASNFECLSP